QAKAGQALTKRLVGFTLENTDAVLLGRETVLRDGVAVGYLTSGGYGYTIGKSVGYGYVRHERGVTDAFLEAGHYELVVANENVPAQIGLKPFYDPQNLRIRS
ncbi:MAG: glycine cleavage T C-terminal barrel domain-containing protein, partial [Albidovulum sp.]